MKISGMPPSAALTGNELVEIVQDGINKKLPLSQLYSAGADGKSAYEVAVINGFVGTEEEWLLSLKGASAYEVAVAIGFVGTPAEWMASLQGVDGRSAYQSAVDAGFVGTEAEWIASLTPSQAGVVMLTANLVASEDLEEGMFVNVWNSAGATKVQKSDSTVQGKHVHGFILTTVATGETVTVYFAGKNDKCSGLVIGDHYLSAVPGRTSQFTPNTSGHVLQTVGLAISSTEMIFQRSDPVILG